MNETCPSGKFFQQATGKHRPLINLKLRPRLFCAVFILFAAALSQAQQRTRDAATIAYVKHYPVSRIEKGLPPKPFGVWFQELIGWKTPVTWEVNDCGEQTGTPADKSRDFPMCVEARAQQAADFFTSVSIQIGTFKRGITRGKPVVRNIFSGESIDSGNYEDSLKGLRQHLKRRAIDAEFFDPNGGVFQISGGDLNGIEKGTEMWIATKDTVKHGGIAIGPKDYALQKNFFNGKIWTFQTEVVDGVSYGFDGKFAKLKLDAHGNIIGENVLRGHLIKFTNGTKAAEADLTFSFQIQGE
jgi:hypothetical protein